MTGCAGGTIPKEGKGGATALFFRILLDLPVALDSPVLGDIVAACWGSTARLPSGASLVAGSEETEEVRSGLGAAFAAWELDGVSPGVT